MTFTQFALAMHPYWFFGALMIYAVSKSSYKDLLAINKESIFKFASFMLFVSVLRIFILKFSMAHGLAPTNLKAMANLPIGATIFTYWEDMCHALPLVLLRKIIGTSKWAWPIHALALIVVMVSFGAGHLYQGILPAMFISLYVPFGVNFGQKKGFGTLAICHMIYDFLTMLTIKVLLCC